MERRFSNVFWKIYDAVEQKHPRVVSNRGGTRSTKTYSTLQFLHTLIPEADTVGDVTSVVSETLPHLKKGAIRDFERIIGKPLKLDAHWSESSHTYTYENGAKLEFFSADAPGKVQGPARKRLFINECNHISYDTYRQLAVRTQGTIYLDYNPTTSFWANEKIEPRDNTVLIISTYKDNPFLTPEQVREIEANAEDANWWKVFGLGEIGTLEGVIYNFEQIDEMPDPDGMVETYGLDFGFTNDPTALIHTYIDTDRKAVYFDELLYHRGMQNDAIAEALQSFNIPRHVPIYADSSEPKTIEWLQQFGWNIDKCFKTTKKAEQVQMLRGYKHYITKRSINLIREHRGYVWAVDKTGKPLNEPIAYNDHAEDAARYSVISYVVASGGQSTYGFGGHDYDEDEDWDD